MNMDFSQMQSSLKESLQVMLDYFLNPWFGYQVLIIAAMFIAAHLLAKRIEPLLEQRARLIKGNPGLLRMVVALLRRTQWILFIVLLTGALLIMRGAIPKSHTHLTSIVVSLALTWLVITVLSRIIRNHSVARLVAIVVWTYVALSILGIADDAAVFLDKVGFSVGAVRITAFLVLKAVVFLTITLWLAVSIGNFLDNRIKRSEELTPSLRVLIGKLLKISLLIVGAVVALSGLGINLTAFTVFSGAVGVGVGFGLQKVVSNFISGIIILVDRSIKPGDTISVGETFGWIRELRARFVSVVTRDGREYLIPNEDFITKEVINWSFSNDLVRLEVEFGVSYDSDPHKVSELAIKAAASVDRVLRSMEPVCWMTGFGESSVDFVLRFWIRDPQSGLSNIRGKVLLAVWDIFKENGVRIPFPHREVIMKTPVRVEGPQGSGQT